MLQTNRHCDRPNITVTDKHTITKKNHKQQTYTITDKKKQNKQTKIGQSLVLQFGETGLLTKG